MKAMWTLRNIRHCRLNDIAGAWTSINMNAFHHGVHGVKREFVYTSQHGSPTLMSVALIPAIWCALAHRGVVMEITKDQVGSGLPSPASLFFRIPSRLI